MEKDDGFEKYARGLASELGLTQEQVAKFSSWEHAQQTAATEAEVARLNAEHDATSKALAEKYGDEASVKIAAANKAADKLGLKQFILNSGLKNNLEVMEKFIAIRPAMPNVA